MSIAEAVKRLIHQFNEDTLILQAQEWSQTPISACKVIIKTLKKTIKSKKELPATRVMALKVPSKQLLNQCILTGNPHFLQYAGKKVLSRLTILASHRKESKEITRGEDIFGPISLASAHSRAASIEFLTCLLLYMKLWAKLYGQEESYPVYYLSYLKLVNFGVTFPSEEDLAAAGNQQISLKMEDLGNVKRSAQLLESLLNQSSADMQAAKQMAVRLQEELRRVEREIGVKTEQGGNEEYVVQLCEMNDYVRGVLEVYEERKSLQTSLISREDDDTQLKKALAASMVPSSHSRDSVSLRKSAFSASMPAFSLPTEADIASKQLILASLHEELASARQEESSLTQSFSLRQTLQRTEYSEDMQGNLSATVDSGLKLKLAGLQRKARDLQVQLQKREKEHRGIAKALGVAWEENQRLKAALAGPSDSSQAVYASQDFETIRLSFNSSIPALVLKPEISVYAQRPVHNPLHFRSSLLSPKGILHSNTDIEVGYLFKDSSLLLYLGNKSPIDICQLHTFICNCQTEGLRVEINKELDEQAITYKNKVNRVLRIERVGVFCEVPRLIVTYE